MKQVKRILLALMALSCGADAVAQQAQASWFDNALSAIGDTTPAAMLSPDQRASSKAWYDSLLHGGEFIYDTGRTDLLLTGYTWHAPYAYPNRHEENAMPWGAGVARTVVDAKDNERILYAMVFSDSHYEPEPFAGYGWVARWPLGSSSLKGGLGYSAFVTSRADTKWFPVPGVIPLASIGNDTFSLYAAWLPFIDIGFVFARVNLDGHSSSPPPIAAGSSRTERPRSTLIYAAAAHVKVDASGIDGVSSSSGNSPLIGLRHFISPQIAVELAGSRERHRLDFPGTSLGSFEREAVTLTAQYHFPLGERARLYGGVGVEYQQLRDQQLLNASLSSSGGLGPAIQGGATYAFDDGLTLNAGMTVSYPHNGLTRNGVDVGNFKLSPAVFSIGVGYAF